MVKDGSVYLRIEEKTKVHIEEAARLKGRTLTSFMVGAAEKMADKVMANPSTRGRHAGIPSFFRNCCREASSGGEGYAIAAYHLCLHLDSEYPYDLELDEWSAEVDRLLKLLSGDDDEGVWRWFTAHYPRAMKLVPRRRRQQFVVGVKRAWEDERITD